MVGYRQPNVFEAVKTLNEWITMEEMRMGYDFRIGLIGLGARGEQVLKNTILPLGVRVAAVCDLYEDRRQKAAGIIQDAGFLRFWQFFFPLHRQNSAHRFLTD